MYVCMYVCSSFQFPGIFITFNKCTKLFIFQPSSTQRVSANWPCSIAALARWTGDSKDASEDCWSSRETQDDTKYTTYVYGTVSTLYCVSAYVCMIWCYWKTYSTLSRRFFCRFVFLLLELQWTRKREPWGWPLIHLQHCTCYYSQQARSHCYVCMTDTSHYV